MDLTSDQIIYESLKEFGNVYAAASEESALMLSISEDGEYQVTFDPLDGSSIINSNFAVGSIYGIWPKGDITKMTGRDQVGAIVGIYGPRTIALVYN